MRAVGVSSRCACVLLSIRELRVVVGWCAERGVDCDLIGSFMSSLLREDLRRLYCGGDGFLVCVCCRACFLAANVSVHLRTKSHRALEAQILSTINKYSSWRLLCCSLGPLTSSFVSSCVNLGCHKDFTVKENSADACRYHRLNPVFHDGGKHWGCCPDQVHLL